MRVLQPAGILCEEKPRADKSTRELAQTRCVKVTGPEAHTVNSFRETGKHKIMHSFAQC